MQHPCLCWCWTNLSNKTNTSCFYFLSLGRENDVCQIGVAVARLCLDFFFAVSSAAWHTVRKKWFLRRENYFFEIGEWRLLGFAGPGKKWFLGWENHFCEIGELRLLGFARFSFFFRCLYCCLQDCRARRVAVAGLCWDFFFCGVYCCLAGCPAKKWFLGLENHFCEIGEWQLLGFLLLRCLLLLGGLPGKKMIFGSGKSFFWNWGLAIAGICWDFFFCGVYCCLAGCPVKKWFLGRENHFSEIGD